MYEPQTLRKRYWNIILFLPHPNLINFCRTEKAIGRKIRLLQHFLNFHPFGNLTYQIFSNFSIEFASYFPHFQNDDLSSSGKIVDSQSVEKMLINRSVENF